MVRTIGAVMIAIGAAYCGIESAISLKKTLRVLKELENALDMMQDEIRFRLLPICELFQVCAETCKTNLKEVFLRAYAIMNADPACTTERAISAAHPERYLPPQAVDVLVMLGRRLGQSDLEGQLQMLGLARTRLARSIDQLEREQPARCRSLCAIGLSTGIALVILLI